MHTASLKKQGENFKANRERVLMHGRRLCAWDDAWNGLGAIQLSGPYQSYGDYG